MLLTDHWCYEAKKKSGILILTIRIFCGVINEQFFFHLMYEYNGSKTKIMKKKLLVTHKILSIKCLIGHIRWYESSIFFWFGTPH